MPRQWKQTHSERWESDDNAVVKIDNASPESRPWRANYRGWMAFAPGPAEHNYLGFYRRRGRFRIPRKFKTAKAAMAAVDREHAYVAGAQSVPATATDGR